MEKKNIENFFEKINKEKEFEKKVCQAKNVQKVKEIAENAGLVISLDEIEAVSYIIKSMIPVKESDELTDLELEKCSGSGSNVHIKYVNRNTNNNPPEIFVFKKNQVPEFDILKEGVAWKVIRNVGRESTTDFYYPIGQHTWLFN